MRDKPVLGDLAGDERNRTRLEVAMDLARRYQAHVMALFIATPVGTPAEITGRGASLVQISEATEIAREKAVSLETEFRERCKRDRVSGTWLVEEGDHLDLLGRHAHCADLAIVSQTDPEHLEDRLMLQFPDHLTLVSGCPVLVILHAGEAGRVPQWVRMTIRRSVEALRRRWRGRRGGGAGGRVLVIPRAGEVGRLGGRVVIAWKSTSGAVRAIRGALPFLKEAEKVEILTVGDKGGVSVPAAEVAGFLARHRVKAEVHSESDGEGQIGKAILAHGRAFGADLLVMWAYGHSRLRELILGGATRHVMTHMTTPVLMSH